MKTIRQEKASDYRKDAMAKTICLICGDHLGDYIYRGKSVCPECLKYIKKNY